MTHSTHRLAPPVAAASATAGEAVDRAAIAPAPDVEARPPASPAAALAALHAGAEALWQRTAPVWPTLTVEVLPCIDSTNAELLRRARAGHTEPVVLTALEQTAGRGRAGRPWITPPGAALALSVGCWLNPADWSGLSLAVGVAVAEALGPAVQLKWPNDLWWRQRKVGGILIETANVPGAEPGRWCVVGIGLNCTAPDLPADASAHAVPPAGLREAEQAGELPAWPLARLLEAVGYAVLRALTAFERTGLAPFLPRYAARDALAGRALCLSDGTHGVADGVAADGSLRLLTANGIVQVHQGDVSVRPC